MVARYAKLTWFESDSYTSSIRTLLASVFIILYDLHPNLIVFILLCFAFYLSLFQLPYWLCVLFVSYSSNDYIMLIKKIKKVRERERERNYLLSFFSLFFCCCCIIIIKSILLSYSCLSVLTEFELFSSQTEWVREDWVLWVSAIAEHSHTMSCTFFLQTERKPVIWPDDKE